MKLLFPLTIWLVLLTHGLRAQEQQLSPYQEAYAAWESEIYGDGSSGSVARTFGLLQNAWRKESEDKKAQGAYYYALAAIDTSRQVSNDQAILLLKEAALVVKDYGVIPSRGKSPKRFRDMASIHARVWEDSDTDPFNGSPIGYEMTRVDGKFIAVQAHANSLPETTVAAAESLLLEGEAIAELLVIGSSGRILESTPVAIEESADSAPSTIKAILAHEPSSSKGPSRFMRQEPGVFLKGTRSEIVGSPASLNNGNEIEAPRNLALASEDETSQPETTLSEIPAWPLVLGAIAVFGVAIILVRAFLRGRAS
ncbi:hypothetical protein HNR46_004268 [Haloferula luteola]|uniref:Uncharacterized protein n=1 Tax=Haloferula luteola TaxID=595692 RepID=A0A840VA84_9BACT|nr:hypothetical protein [Haloferula luteola]MBB5353996.1 hypothetical protein [Haloferula luteola]